MSDEDEPAPSPSAERVSGLVVADWLCVCVSAFSWSSLFDFVIGSWRQRDKQTAPSCKIDYASCPPAARNGRSSWVAPRAPTKQGSCWVWSARSRGQGWL